MAILSSIFSKIRHAWQQSPRTTRVVFCLLLATAIAFLIYLLDAKTPWDSKILKRLESGRSLRSQEYIIIGSWWAALINLILTIGLLSTIRFWMRPLSDQTPPPATTLSSAATNKKFFIAGGVAILALLILAAPRMSLSLWGDESYSIRRFVIGEINLEDGVLTHEKLTLKDHLWDYANPNNHILFTLAAKASLTIWELCGGEHGLGFSEVAFRFPSLIAAAITILLLGHFLRLRGYTQAVYFAMLLLPFHPWFLKYASEGRGYAMMLAFLAGSWVALHHLYKCPNWRPVLAYCFCQAGMLLCYPGALYFVTLQSLASFWMIFHTPNRFPALARMVVSQVLAAMLLIQIMAPNVPQLLKWLDRDRAKADLGLRWLQDFWAHTTAGMHWHAWNTSNPLCTSFEQLSSFSKVLLVYLLPLLLLAGLFHFLRRNSGWRLWFLAVALSPFITFFLTQARGNILYLWYLIFYLPFIIVCLAIALEIIPKSLRLSPILIWLTFFGFLFSYFNAAHFTIYNLRHFPLEAQRDSVQLSRPDLDPYAAANKEIMTVQFVFSTLTYDPNAIELRKDEEAEHLKELLLIAQQRSVPLYVNFGSENFARTLFPEIFTLLDDPEKFSRLQEFPGMDHHLSRVVYQMIPKEL